MKLYIRDEIDELDGLTEGLLREILEIMEKNTETYMPGFTHLQKAQPITLRAASRAYPVPQYSGRNRQPISTQGVNGASKATRASPVSPARLPVALSSTAQNVKPCSA